MKLDRFLIEEFIARCQQALDMCVLHKELFDRNTEHGHMKIEPYYSLFGRIQRMTQEHSSLEITKLHDPGQQNGRSNLSLDYIIKLGAWSAEVYKELTELRDQMGDLYSAIKPARNRALCHNDVESIQNREVLGAFEKDADEPYFAILEKFLNLVCLSSFNERFSFERTLKPDIDEFIAHFNRTEQGGGVSQTDT